MADIELIIKIPEEKYLWAKNLVNGEKEDNPVVLAIGNGQPLPKGHGRLIDANDVNNHILGYVDLRTCPTIIESDKSEME